jgi:hypothetical protein
MEALPGPLPLFFAGAGPPPHAEPRTYEIGRSSILLIFEARFFGNFGPRQPSQTSRESMHRKHRNSALGSSRRGADGGNTLIMPNDG